MLAGDVVIVSVAADPKPLNPVRSVVAQRTVVFPHPDRPDLPEALEMKRRMPRIGLEEFEVLVGDRLNGLRQRFVERPKPSRRGVLQRGRVLCALWSAIDSSMRRSSFPAAASASI